MKNYRSIILFAGLAVCMVFVSGCLPPIPDYHAGKPTVYARVGANDVTNEVVMVVDASFDWVMPVIEGDDHLYYTQSTIYYFSGHNVRWRPLHFLKQQRPFPDWELIAPVQATNSWVRLQGFRGSYDCTNGLVITVFTPRRMLYQQRLLTSGPPETNFVHFLDGNRTVSYKSDSDDFSYNVLENKLEVRK